MNLTRISTHVCARTPRSRYFNTDVFQIPLIRPWVDLTRWNFSPEMTLCARVVSYKMHHIDARSWIAVELRNATFIVSRLFIWIRCIARNSLTATWTTSSAIGHQDTSRVTRVSDTLWQDRSPFPLAWTTEVSADGTWPVIQTRNETR